MQINITTTPTRLDDPDRGYPEEIVIRDPSANIYLGGPNVTIATNDATDGFPYKTTDTPLTLRPTPEGLWAVTATTATVEVLRL